MPARNSQKVEKTVRSFTSLHEKAREIMCIGHCGSFLNPVLCADDDLVDRTLYVP